MLRGAALGQRKLVTRNLLEDVGDAPTLIFPKRTRKPTVRSAVPDVNKKKARKIALHTAAQTLLKHTQSRRRAERDAASKADWHQTVWRLRGCIV
jgi:hypothetical protein